MSAPRGRVAQRGATMVEVLVAVIVFAAGMLGVANLQSVSLRMNHAAVVRTEAVLAAADVLDRMRANRGAAGDYAIGIDDGIPAGSGVASADLAEWREQLAAALPSGSGSVALDAEGNVTVIVRWQDFDDAALDLTERDATNHFEFRTRL